MDGRIDGGVSYCRLSLCLHCIGVFDNKQTETLNWGHPV